MKITLKKLIIINFLSIVLLTVASLFFINLNKVEASSPIYIPPECPTACNEDNNTNCFVPDNDCVSRKLFDPSYPCFENKCRGTAGSADKADEVTTLLQAFGTKVIVKTNDPVKFVAVLINLAITTFLGLISVYAIIYGVYVGGVKRAQSIDDAEIAAANKTLVTLIAGFILAWSFIFIIQVVSSILGLGNLSDLELISSSGEATGDTITID
jgi:hypothetical protein